MYSLSKLKIRAASFLHCKVAVCYDCIDDFKTAIIEFFASSLTGIFTYIFENKIELQINCFIEGVNGLIAIV